MLKHKLSGKSAFLPNKHNSQLGFCMTALTLGHHNSISKYFSFLVCGVFWIGVHTLPEVGLRQSKQSPEIGNTQSCPPTDLTRSTANGHHRYGYYEQILFQKRSMFGCFVYTFFLISSYMVHDLFSLEHQIDIWTDSKSISEI